MKKFGFVLLALFGIYIAGSVTYLMREQRQAKKDSKERAHRQFEENIKAYESHIHQPLWVPMDELAEELR